ncbi:hypothetical protein DHEL01_v204880 [Diaporthe helianthi]|uniref:Uncharacterized protein n=1 Tax=Diaporthe helianthi TaxID=158607 RepID=A0A2P5I2I3_DIAHE|nr:hypothetical protein DHEL01_v204880 [Diaporthe helianthi]
MAWQAGWLAGWQVGGRDRHRATLHEDQAVVPLVRVRGKRASIAGLVGCKVGYQGAAATAMAVKAASCFFWVVIGVEVGEVISVIGYPQAPAVDLCPLGGSEAWESSPLGT